jgi:outer membrane protein TolC
MPLAAAALALALATSPAASAQGASRPLAIEEAVASALASDPGVIGANLDWLSAKAKADAASWKKYPSLSASAGYQRLSDLSSVVSFGSMTIPIDSLDNVFSLALNMQYVVPIGPRIRESIAIAGLQAQSKDVARESARRSLAFDVRRAYWEAVRATYNRATLERNLELMRQVAELATRQLGQGVATRADQLAAQMRLEQATEDLGDARALQKRAFLSLASLAGADVASLGISAAAEGDPLPFELSTKPDDAALAAASALPGASAADDRALVAEALARRPETRVAALSRELAERSASLSRSALFPTVALSGNYTLADPNQRAAFQSDPWKFTGTWSLGVQVSYDVGGLPAALDDVKAQSFSASKAKSDEARQRNAVAMDVENCLVNLERARRDLASTSAMVEQARENLRVVQGKVAAGTAKDIDLSSSGFDLLRMEFAVTNKRIDALIALADLARATASEDVQ